MTLTLLLLGCLTKTQQVESHYGLLEHDMGKEIMRNAETKEGKTRVRTKNLPDGKMLKITDFEEGSTREQRLSLGGISVAERVITTYDLSDSEEIYFPSTGRNYHFAQGKRYIMDSFTTPLFEVLLEDLGLYERYTLTTDGTCFSPVNQESCIVETITSWDAGEYNHQAVALLLPELDTNNDQIITKNEILAFGRADKEAGDQKGVQHAVGELFDVALAWNNDISCEHDQIYFGRHVSIPTLQHDGREYLVVACDSDKSNSASKGDALVIYTIGQTCSNEYDVPKYLRGTGIGYRKQETLRESVPLAYDMDVDGFEYAQDVPQELRTEFFDFCTIGDNTTFSQWDDHETWEDATDMMHRKYLGLVVELNAIANTGGIKAL